jgi:tetratricopeptide (TPR) repeat protein
VKSFAVFALGTCLALSYPAVIKAQTAELTPAQTRSLALQAFKAGQFDLTAQIADALLLRDPNDRIALIMQSRALRALGRPGDAIAPARAAWALSTKDTDQFIAAMTMAEALSSDGKRTRAQFWLRRASELAPNDAAKATAINGFKYVKSRNPLRLSFSGSLAPSSNINNGSTATKLGQFTLTGASVALSGVEATLGFSARYMLPPSRTQQTELIFSATGQSYRLSDKAKVLSPTSKGSDFAYGAIEVGLAHRRNAGKAGLSFEGTLGRNWYGGKPLSDYLKLDAGVQWLLNPRTQAALSVQGETQKRLDGANRDTTIVGLTGAVTHLLANQDSLRFSANLRNIQSKATWIDHRAATLRLDYARAAPIHGISLSGGINFEARDYDISPFTASGRQDRKIGMTVTAVFNRWDYMGFVPSLELTAARNNSNISLYERREFGLSFGIKSAF